MAKPPQNIPGRKPPRRFPLPPGQAKQAARRVQSPDPRMRTLLDRSFSIVLQSETPEAEALAAINKVNRSITQNKNVTIQRIRNEAGELTALLFQFNPLAPSYEVRAAIDAIQANPGLPDVLNGEVSLDNNFEDPKLKDGDNVNFVPGTKADLIAPLQVVGSINDPAIISTTEFFSGAKSLRVGHGVGTGGLRYQAFWNADCNFTGEPCAIEKWKVSFVFRFPADIAQGPANVDLSIQGPSLQYGSDNPSGYGSQIIWSTAQVPAPGAAPVASTNPIVNGAVPVQPSLVIPFDDAFHTISWELLDADLFSMRLTIDGTSQDFQIQKQVSNDPPRLPMNGFSAILSWTSEVGDSQLVYMDDFEFSFERKAL